MKLYSFAWSFYSIISTERQQSEINGLKGKRQNSLKYEKPCPEN